MKIALGQEDSDYNNVNNPANKKEVKLNKEAPLFVQVYEMERSDLLVVVAWNDEENFSWTDKSVNWSDAAKYVERSEIGDLTIADVIDFPDYTIVLEQGRRLLANTRNSHLNTKEAITKEGKKLVKYLFG